MGKSKAPTPTEILANIKAAEDYQHVDNWYKNTKRMLGYLVGDWGTKMYSSKYVINTMYNLVNLMIPNLYFQNPYLRLTPKGKYINKKQKGTSSLRVLGSKAAMLCEAVLNNEIKNMEFSGEVTSVILDCLAAGFGVLKVGHSPSTASEQDSDYLDDGSIFAQRVSPFNYLFDPMATSPDDADWEAYRWTAHLDDVKDNKEYKNTKDLEGTSLSDTNPKKKKKEDSKVDSKYVELYEYHDHRSNKVYIVTKDSGKKKRILKESDSPYKFKGSHFIVLRLTGNNDEFRSISPLLMVEDECLAINEITSLTINHLQKFAGMIFYEQGALDQDDLDRFESGEQGDILQVQNGALRDGRIKRESPLTSGMEYYNSLNTFRSLIDSTLGIPDFQRSTASGKRKTAYEVNLSASEASNRRTYYMDFVKKFIVSSTRRILSLMQQFYDRKQWIMLKGDFIEWVEWTRLDIQGDFMFDFDVNELRAYSAAQAQALINAIQLMGQSDFFKPVWKQIDPMKMADKIFKNLDLEVDSVKRDTALSHIEQDPYLENQYALDHKRIPDPHPSEPHEDHIEIHEQGILKAAAKKDAQAYTELARHIQMHQYSMQVMGVMAGKEDISQPQQQPQQQSQQPQQSPLEAEAQGGFTYNQQTKDQLG